MLSLPSTLALPLPDQDIGSPAILRLRLHEAKIAARRPMDEEARREAALLIDSLRRAIAERPCLSFADVVAKLKTSDDFGDGEIGSAADESRRALRGGALAGLCRAGSRR